MILEEVLITQILEHEDIVALIGDRVYPIIMPQDDLLPCLIYQTITTDANYCQAGNDHDVIQMQFSLLNKGGIKESKQFMKAVRSQLELFSGVCDDGYILRVEYNGMVADDFQDDTRTYHLATNFKIILSKF